METDYEPRFYILDEEHLAVPATMSAWAKFFEEYSNRVVAKTTVGDAEVSTIFIGLDHRYMHKGPPQIFETMIFGGPRNQHTQRYATWRAAMAGHQRLVKLLGGDIGRHE